MEGFNKKARLVNQETVKTKEFVLHGLFKFFGKPLE